MKRQNKKAFTLVELLVVIAILAILAAVAVVGYTSFIKNAAVSNDESVVAQMNRYLEALKADSTSEFYGKDIHAGNVQKLTALILKESGLEELAPEAEKYGYDFYFDLEEGKYVSLHGEDAGRSDIGRNAFKMFSASAAESESKYEVRLENSISKDKGYRYFLVSTSSELAELIASVYAFNGDNGSVTTEQIDELISALEDTPLHEFISTSVIVTNGVNYRPAGNKVPETVFFVNNVTALSVKTVSKNGGSWSEGVVASDILANVDNLTLPDTIESCENGALNINDGANIHSDLTADDFAKIGVGEMTNATLNLKDGQHTTESATVGIKNVQTGATKPYDYPYVVTDIGILNGKDGIYVPSGDADLAANVITVPAEISEFNIALSFTHNQNDGSTKPVLGKNIVDIVTDKPGAVEWSYDVDSEKIVIKFVGDDKPDSINLTATSENGTEFNFKVNVQSITDGIFYFNGVELDANTTNYVSLTYNGVSPEYTIDRKGELSYFYKGVQGVCSENVYWSYASDSEATNETLAKNENGSITASGIGSGTLTIKVGSENYAYLTYTVKVDIANVADFPLQAKNNNNFTVFGNKNTVLLSDLFALKDGASIPEGAQLVIYSSQDKQGNTYLKPNRGLVDGKDGVSVDKNTQTVSGTDLTQFALNFAGTTDPDEKGDEIRIAVVDKNGVRISEDITVDIVDAYNIRNFSEIMTVTNIKLESSNNETTESWSDVLGNLSLSELKNWIQSLSGEMKDSATFTWSSDRKSITVTEKWSSYSIALRGMKTKQRTTILTCDVAGYHGNSLVLLDDIAMSNDESDDDKSYAISRYFNMLDIPKNTTFYGNGFTFDVTKGRIAEAGIINLGGTIRDTKIVGALYTTFAFRAHEDYGSSVLYTTSGALVENCYVSGTRSPIRTGADTTIKNSVIYGGLYANVNVTGGNLNIEGEVITVNQINSNDSNENKQVGLGIAFWWSTDANKSKVIMGDNAKLTQYNFICEEDSAYLPTIGINLFGISAGADIGTVFTEVINSKDNSYQPFIFYRTVGGEKIRYVNTGVCYLNEETNDAAKFYHNGKYGNISYTYAPSSSAIKKALNSVIGREDLPVVINTLKYEDHTENQAFFNSDITKNAAAIFDDAVYGFGADGNILTNGK